MDSQPDTSQAIMERSAHRARSYAGPWVALGGALVVGYMIWSGYLGRVEIVLNAFLLTGLAVTPFVGQSKVRLMANAVFVIATAVVLFTYSSLSSNGAMNAGLPLLVIVHVCAGFYLGRKGLLVLTLVYVAFAIALGVKLAFWPSAEETSVPMGQAIGKIIQFTLAVFISHWVTSSFLGEQMRMLEELRRSNRMKSEFLANMSHEIRTPMNGVIGMSEMLKNANLDSQSKYFVDIIYSSGKALLTIINDILDYSKIEAGKMDIESIDFDLDRLVVECASVLNLTAEKKGISLTASIKPGTPTLLQGDPTRLRQILLNLMGNAFKFTNQGGVSLRVYQSQGAQEGMVLKFEIRDTGIGIGEAQQKKLFSAFAQADSDTSRKYGGTGLGLNISKKLAGLMGGEIGVESVEGKGSCFWFTICFQPCSSEYKVVGHYDEKDFAGKRILVVDDSHEYIDILKEKMQSWDMDVEVAYHGKEGIDKVLVAESQGKPFDMLILDFQMPGMTGTEVSQALKEIPSATNIKRVLITAMSQSPEQPELDAAGILFSVKKPIGAADLMECIGKALFPDHLHLKESDKQRDVNDLGHLRVLVAEDNAVNQLVIKSMLKKIGVDAEVVIDGKEALTRYGENPGNYDVVLMDCMMPEMDGYEATQAIRQFEQEENIPRTPIFALTAHAMNEHREKSIECGMDDHICKPIEINELREKLLQLVANNKAA